MKRTHPKATSPDLAILLAILIATSLNGCGGGSGGGTVVATSNLPTEAPSNLSVSADGVKSLKLEWDFVRSANHFIINEDLNGTSNYVEIQGATDIAALSHSMEVTVHKTLWGTTQFTVSACDTDETCRFSSNPIVLPRALSAAVIGYFKASNTAAYDEFGRAVALSADGNTLAIGARSEDSSASGIDGNQSDNSATNAGAVYVFTHSGSTWTQQAYIKASNTGANDNFGQTLALSADGNTLVVGAFLEDSSASGVDGDQSNNGASDSGAVYVFTRTGSTWSQEAYVKASTVGSDDQFGYYLALSSDGNTLAVGAIGEDSSVTGVDGDQSNNGASGSGAVYVFTRVGSTWSQQAYIKASNTGIGDRFGSSLALSPDGNTLAVGASGEGSSTTGIDGDQSNNSAYNAGAVYVFTRIGSAWSQQAYIKASNAGAYDQFGYSVALNSDGNTLAVGAFLEESSATGIDGNQASNSASGSGAVYVFTRIGSVWSQEAYVKASNTGSNDQLGYAVALSSDGNTLVVGARAEASSAIGVNGDQSDGASGAGAVYVFSRSGSTWSQVTYVKASNTGVSDFFGASVALSADSNTLAVGACQEYSAATGIGGNQANNSAEAAGAVYLY